MGAWDERRDWDIPVTAWPQGAELSDVGEGPAPASTGEAEWNCLGGGPGPTLGEVELSCVSQRPIPIVCPWKGGAA